VQLAINGHMHKCLPSAQFGETVWHNPGNISRVNVDDRDHKPRAWKLVAGTSDLIPMDLPFDTEAFDLTGVKQDLPAVTAVMATSLFPNCLLLTIPWTPQNQMTGQSSRRTCSRLQMAYPRLRLR